MEDSFTIELFNVSKTFRPLRHRTIRDYIITFRKKNLSRIKAIQEINFKVGRGETFGIIGRNGSGKSTLIDLIMGSMLPDKGGSVKTNGKKIRLSLGLGVDSNLTARDNIYVNGSILGLTFKKIGDKFDEIIEFAGLEEFVDLQVKNFSNGMKARLNFSIAMHAEAEIFLLDEFFGGVGDEDFRKKSDQAFKDRILEGKTNIMVSHSMGLIKNYCHRVMWLDKGKIVQIGQPEEVINLYQESFKELKK